MALDAFTIAFFEAALWSSTDNSRDDGGDPLDKKYSIYDIDPKCMAALTVECARFQEENATAIDAVYNACHNPRSSVESQFGHDFWLTRCGHGSGFWDGDYPEEMGETLTEASKRYGNVDLYVGDDGIIYAMGYETGRRWREKEIEA